MSGIHLCTHLCPKGEAAFERRVLGKNLHTRNATPQNAPYNFMSQSYTKREIAYQLQVSPRTIQEDVKFLQLAPVQGDRGANLFSQSDFNLIRQLRSHCADKTKGRESFVPTPEIEIVKDDSYTVRKMEAVTAYVDIYKESLELGLSQDPLFDLQLLQRISDNHWLLPTKRLAPLFGISAKHLSSCKEYCYCGFVATREAYFNGRALWKISANNH